MSSSYNATFTGAMTGAVVGGMVGEEMAPADKAKHFHCTMMDVKRPRFESTQQKQEYAECIQLLYPPVSGGASVLLMKAVIVFTFLTMILCARRTHADGEGVVIGLLMGAGVAACCIVACLLIGGGIWFLFN